VQIAGGWGRMGMTHLKLSAADESIMEGSLRTAWKLRMDKNARPVKKTAKKARVKR